MCIWVCLVCRDVFEDRCGLMRCPKPKLHQCMISENMNILHVCAYYQTWHHFHHHSNHHLCNRRTYKEEINQCLWRDIPFWNIEIFHFGFFCFGICDVDIPCYLLELFIYVQEVNEILVCLLLVSFGFSFFGSDQDWFGSLARCTCFSNVDLSCIFWNISNPFFQNTVSSLLMCFSSSFWNIFQ